MTTLTYARAVYGPRLMDELLTLPALQPVPGPLGPEAVFTLIYSDAVVTLNVPDDADEQAIETIVQAHDETPPTPPDEPDFGPDAADLIDQAAAAVTQLRAYLSLPSPTGAQTVAAVKLVIRCVLFVLRRQL